MALSPTGHFEVSWAGRHQDTIDVLAERARRRGVLPQFVSDLKQIEDHLATDPVAWGDPQYHFHYLELVVYRRVLDLLQLYYAVDPWRRIVYVQKILPRTGQALDL